MTKKDFILLAKVVSAHLDNGDHDQLDGIASVHVLALSLADALATTNPAFDRSRFLTACGITE
jgi:hypothetical protein